MITCDRCGQKDHLYYMVPNSVWLAVVPEEHRKAVWCLRCFDQAATAAGVDWARILPVPGEIVMFELRSGMDTRISLSVHERFRVYKPKVPGGFGRFEKLS